MAGKKRNNPTSKQQQPDFKRIKAKVGKRAPKPANETDTKFRAATLHVSDQHAITRASSTTTSAAAAAAISNNEVDSNDSGVLISDRGKTVEELTIQLGHPAGAVRLSAIKGIKNIIIQACVNNNNGATAATTSLKIHLSILLPACAKSACVDEDDNVRLVGRDALQELLLLLSLSAGKVNNNHHQQQLNSNNGQETTTVQISNDYNNVNIGPFTHLLMAYATSALNSLDRSTRIDGARVIQVLSTSIPELIAPFVPTILPPYVGLASERTKYSGEVIQSLASLLTAYSANNQQNNAAAKNSQNDNSIPNLLIVGPNSGNTIFLPGRKPRHNLRRLNKISDLPTLDNIAAWHGTNKAENLTVGSSIGVQQSNQSDVVHGLLSKLCDVLVEASGVEANSTVAPSSKSSSSTIFLNISMISFVTQSIRHLWNLFAISIGSDNTYKLGKKILNLLLELFPVGYEHVKSTEHSQVLDINAILGGTILDIAFFLSSYCTTNDNKNQLDNKWIRVIHNYIVPCLSHGQSSKQFFGLFHDFLLLDNSDMNDIRVEMVKQIQKVYFSSDDIITNSDKVNKLARSIAGRNIVLIVRDLAQKHSYDFNGHRIEQPLLLIIQCLVAFLQAWGADYLQESKVTLELLHAIVRRRIVSSPNAESDNLLFAPLRSSLSVLVKNNPPRNKEQKIYLKSRDKNQTIYEQYPENLQRLYLSLVVMLESPSDDTISGLGNFVSKCICTESATEYDNNNHHPLAISYTINAIHTIRRTISMQKYLGFLVDCLGINRFKAKISFVKNVSQQSSSSSSTTSQPRIGVKHILAHDCAVETVSQCLVDCNPMKTLPKLGTLLLHWADISDLATETSAVVLRVRAAITIIARLLGAQRQYTVSKTPLLISIVPALESSVVTAIYQLLPYFTTLTDTHHREAVLGPFLGIIVVEQTIMTEILKKVESNIKKEDHTTQTLILQTLVNFMRDPRLAMISFDQDRQQLSRTIQSIEAQVQDCPAAHLAGRLKIIMNIAAKLCTNVK